MITCYDAATHDGVDIQATHASHCRMRNPSYTLCSVCLDRMIVLHAYRNLVCCRFEALILEPVGSEFTIALECALLTLAGAR